jgi:hypothetical protein
VSLFDHHFKSSLMNFQKFFLLTVLVLLLGCNQDSFQEDIVMPTDQEIILSPLVSYHADAALHKSYTGGEAVARPFKVRASGIMEIGPNPEVCGPYFEVLISGNGVGTHLGNYSVTNTYCTDGVDPVSPITGIATAANGDQIFVLVTDIWDNEEDGDRYISYIITGGTGIFTDATGNYILHGLVDYEELVWDLEGEGTISY